MSRKVIIIGAGAAGLTCAKRLIENGFEVSIFDKSRGLGGRMASRRIKNGGFNHGASVIPDFRNQKTVPEHLKNLLETAVEKKVLISQGNAFTPFAGMKTFTSYLSEGIDVQKDSELISVTPANSGIELQLNNASKMQVNEAFLIFAIPQPQLLALLQNHFPEIFILVQPAKMYASVTGLFAFDKKILFDHSLLENERIYSFHENSRIGQHFIHDCWTIHSKNSYGKKLSHLDKTKIKDHLFNEFKQLVSINLPQPVYAEGHRWRYGFTKKALDKNFIFHRQNKIGICGDWCRGDNLLDALISGTLLADKISATVIE